MMAQTARKAESEILSVILFLAGTLNTKYSNDIWGHYLKFPSLEIEPFENG